MLLSNSLFKKNIIESKGRYIQNIDILVMGNSHPECAINDSLLPIKFVNIAQSGEPLIYTCIKARTILKLTHNDTVIIEFTNNSLQTINWVLDDDRLYTNYKMFFSKMKLDEHFFY